MTTPESGYSPEQFTLPAMHQLYENFSTPNVYGLRTPKFMQLAHREPGEYLDFVRIGEEKPAVYIPGFTEGYISKAPLGLALAEPTTIETRARVGGDETTRTGLKPLATIIPGQNRRGIDRKATESGRGKKNATYSQALNYLQLLEENRGEGPVTVIAHSQGSIVVQDMVEIAKACESDIFDDANIILLAPSGMNKKENIFKLGYRFVKTIVQESKSPKLIHDVDGSQLKAGQKNMLKNPLRSWREARELARERLNPKQLVASGIGSLAIINYGEDTLYSHTQTDETAQELMAAGAEHGVAVNYLTPVQFGKKDAEGNAVAAQAGATHNDEQFNPNRVAHAVRQHLELVEESKLAAKKAKATLAA